MVFDIVINNTKGGLFCIYFKRNSDKVATALDSMKPKISIQLVHDILVHLDESHTRMTSKGLGQKLVCGTIKTCEAYASVKEKQKNVTKSSYHVPAKDNCGRVLLDIYTTKSPKEIKL